MRRNAGGTSPFPPLMDSMINVGDRGMRPVINWADVVPVEEETTDPNDFKIAIHDLAFKPDGSQYLLACGCLVYCFNADDALLICSLPAHKDIVYCVAWSNTGDRFASGSLDKSVIIWNDQFDGLLKYQHNDSVQCLAFSPTATVLISCSTTDFGIWSKDIKTVSKQATKAKCMCCAWNSDGTYYAIGMSNGQVQIRTGTAAVTDEPITVVQRAGEEPIIDIAFSTTRVNNFVNEILAIADWNQSIGFYSFDGKATLRNEKVLSFDPTCIDFFNDGNFMLLGGSNKMVSVHMRDGTDLGTILRADGWIWKVKHRPKSNPNNVSFMIACTDGCQASYNLGFGTVHSLHKDLYAYRDSLTNVIIQHLGRQRHSKLICNGLVKKVAIYHNRLAVQLNEKIIVYRLASGEKEGEQVEYKVLDRITSNIDCQLLVVTSHHVILCNDKDLHCLDHKGMKQREWRVEAPMKYIKVVGGPPGREAILLGLKNGLIMKIFVDNPFPLEILRIRTEIRCFDVSLSKRKLGVVDYNNVLMIFDTITKELLFQEPNVTSVCFNAENEDLVCYSGDNWLYVRAKNFSPYQQYINGLVVGFTGRRVHYLSANVMHYNEVPLSSQLLQYLDAKDFVGAYKLASLGVTEKDWKLLGMEALESMEFNIAKKAFHRIKDARALLLMNDVEDMKACGKTPEYICAYIYAYTKRFKEAAKVLHENGMEQVALEMFSELHLFDQAQEFLSSASTETQKSLLRRKADWARAANDLHLAADMLMASGDFDKAVKILIENDWMDKVLQVANRLDRSDANLIRVIGNYLASKGEFTVAATLFSQIGDIKSIAQMHVNAEHWDDAFAVVERHQFLAEDVYLPYARWLSEKDMFDEAQIAYGKAGHSHEAFTVLRIMADKAVKEHRYLDASYYFRIMGRSQHTAKEYANEKSNNVNKALTEMLHKSDCYYVYNYIYKYVIEPFTEKSHDVLLNMSRYLALMNKVEGISQVNVLYTLTKLSINFHNYKTTRESLAKLRIYRVPQKFQNTIEISSLEVRAKPYADSDEFLPVCYSCGTNNPILGAHTCAHCNAPFVYSFITFEILPVLEFHIPEDMLAIDAKDLINAEPPVNEATNVIDNLLQEYRAHTKEGILLVTSEDLRNLEPSLVFIAELSESLPIKYYVKVIPDFQISQCPECKKLFNSDDFQEAVLQLGHCPVCRFKVKLYETDMDFEDDSEFS